MRSALPLFAAFGLTACATVPAVRGDGMARLGEATRVGMLVVTPLRVVEDSRCPVDVQCVWAGRLVVATRIEAGGRRELTDLELGRPHVAHGRSIALTSVLPAKKAAADRPVKTLFGFSGG